MEQTYLAQLIDRLLDEKGKPSEAKIRRINWPEGDYITAVDPKKITARSGSSVAKKVDIIDIASGKPVKGAKVEIGGTDIQALTILDANASNQFTLPDSFSFGTFRGPLCMKHEDGKDILAWVPDSDERITMDWTLVQEEEKEEE